MKRLAIAYGEGKQTTFTSAGHSGSLDTYEWKSADTDVKFLWLGPLGGSFVWIYKPSDVPASAKP